MPAPTVWEEGRIPGSRVVRLAVLGVAVLATLDVLVFGRLTPLFDVGFTLVCVGAALAVRPSDFFRVGVMPPFLLLGLCLVLALLRRTAIAGADDGVVQAVISGLAHHAWALFAGDALALGVLAVRRRVAALRLRQAVAQERAQERTQEKRAGSPRPTRVTSGDPEERSTTVVGSEVSSPASRTASSR